MSTATVTRNRASASVLGRVSRWPGPGRCRGTADPTTHASIRRGRISRRFSGRRGTLEGEGEERAEVALEQQVEDRAGDEAGEHDADETRTASSLRRPKMHRCTDPSQEGRRGLAEGRGRLSRSLAVGRDPRAPRRRPFGARAVERRGTMNVTRRYVPNTTMLMACGTSPSGSVDREQPPQVRDHDDRAGAVGGELQEDDAADRRPGLRGAPPPVAPIPGQAETPLLGHLPSVRTTAGPTQKLDTRVRKLDAVSTRR